MVADDDKLIDQLRPTKSPRLIDLVKEAGVDVSSWALNRYGKRVKVPASNPNYCNDWSFGGANEPTVLNLWFGQLRCVSENVVWHGNVRAIAEHLEKIVQDATSIADQIRARVQSKRASAFDTRVRDAALQAVGNGTIPFVRIIIGEGTQVQETDLGKESSSMTKRFLDGEPWLIKSYDDNIGEILLVRGLGEDIHQIVRSQIAADQFEAPEVVGRKPVSAYVFKRSALVRKEVLDRSKGKCELCGEVGFKMVDGRAYLETHHVVPLSEGGADSTSNVVALCPKDHKRAHYAVDRDEIRKVLLQMGIDSSPQ